MSLAAIQQLVDDLVRDSDQVISSTQRDDAIANALARYSVDAPRRVIEDVIVAGDGSLPLPDAWTVGTSRLVSAEYPIGQRPIAFIPPELLDVRATPSGEDILLLVSLPVGDAVRLTYSALHVLDAGTDTVPVTHRRALAALAASDHVVGEPMHMPILAL